MNSELPAGASSPSATSAEPATPAATSPVVVLVGAPGSGKTSVAQALSSLIGLPVRDTDWDIETRTARSIPDIFANDGEATFRELEQQAVVAGLAEHTGILALGGGAVLATATRRALAGHRVVHLKVSMSQGIRRTGMNTGRPLLTGINPRATFKALLDARLPLYQEVAAWEIDTDELTVPQVAAQIAAWIKETA